MGKVGYLSTLHDKYYDRGLRVVAISDEPVPLIRAEVIEERKGTYWMGSDPGNETMDGFTDGGRTGIPHFYLIDENGTVVDEGFPSEERLVELLRGMFDDSIGRELHADLAEAQKNYERGAFGKAWSQAGDYIEEDDEALTADAAFLREKVEGLAEHRMEWIESDLDPRKPPRSYGTLLEVELRFAGLPIADWAEERCKELDDEPEVKRDKKAWKALRAALERDLRSNGAERKVTVARQYYERVVEKHGFTEAGRCAENAIARLDEELGDKG